MPIKSFRGLIANDTIDTVVLHTNDGSSGYKIIKLEAMPNEPSGNSGTNIIKIFSVPQTTATAVIDFSDQTLLAAAVIGHNASAFQYPPETTVVFDNVIFNQDIYITQLDADGNSTACNYHIELEKIKLDLNQNTVATLKDIRNVRSQT